MIEYKKRIADALLERKLQGKPAVLIEGPKWCGKTTTAEQLCKSKLDLGEDRVLNNSRDMMEINPSMLLDGQTPRLIDEWQTIPSLWDTVRNVSDKRGEMSQFVLTGSSVLPQADATIHSGTGRFGRMRMRPMSLYESEDSNGCVSIKDLFNQGVFEPRKNDISIDELAFLTCRGGWPAAIALKADIALDQAFDYVDSVAEYDMQRVDGVKRDPSRVRRLMRSFARNVSGQAAYTTLCADMVANDTQKLDEDTIADYIKALKRLFVVEDLEAWNPNLRSKTAIRTSDTRHFVDPSIGTASLGISPKDLIGDLETFGLCFEDLAIRDLRVYADANDGKVFHYRDNTGLECDAVMHLRDGKYSLIEVKLGGRTKIEEGVASLKALADKIDTTRMPKPSFMMVLIGVGEYAYRRPDGIYVVPIGCLKP